MLWENVKGRGSRARAGPGLGVLQTGPDAGLTGPWCHSRGREVKVTMRSLLCTYIENYKKAVNADIVFFLSTLEKKLQ